VAQAPASAAILVRDAGVALAHGNYEAALEQLERAAAIDPAVAGLEDLTDVAQQQRAVAETRARLRRRIDEQVLAARDLVARGDLAAASALLRGASKLKSDDTEVKEVQAEIRQAMAKTSRRRAAGSSAAAGERVSANADARTPKERRRARPGKPGPKGTRREIDGERDLLDG
jgi:hypothetical protein